MSTEPVTSWVPIPKIATAGTIGVPLAVVLAWMFDMPTEVAGAMGALIATAIGYLTPPMLRSTVNE